MSIVRSINDGEKITAYRLLMMASWIAYPIMRYINILCSNKSILGINGSFVVPFVYITLIIFSLREIWNKKSLWGGIIYTFFSLSYLISYAFYPRNEQYLDENFTQFFFVVLPYVFVGLHLDINKFKTSFTLLSIVSIAIHALYQLWYAKAIAMKTGLVEDMVGAYMILPHVLFLLWIALKTKKIVVLIPGLLGALFLFALGNRGSIVCVAIFAVLMFLFSREAKRSNLIRVFVVVFGVVTIIFSDPIAQFLSNLFLDFGMSNRVFDKILNEEFFTSDARNTLRQNIVEAIINGPLWGYGLCGDRVITGGSYAHNFFVEIIADFGIASGFILCAIFVVICARALLASRTKEERFFCILLLANFIGLMLSGSLIEDYQWAFLLGFSIRMLSQRSIQSNIYE